VLQKNYWLLRGRGPTITTESIDCGDHPPSQYWYSSGDPILRSTSFSVLNTAFSGPLTPMSRRQHALVTY
jgi:hypothetical protein